MPDPSRIIILVEDQRHEMLVRRYLRKCSIEPHQMTIVPSPSGKGSAEHWVRTRFAKEVSAYRHRSTRAGTALIVAIDADAYTVDQRLARLAQTLNETGGKPLLREEAVALLVPKRNIETWILALNEYTVDETTDYKPSSNDWSELIPKASNTLYVWTRSNAVLPNDCIDSLRRGVAELNRLGL
jgi:hypothetical protein